MVARALNERMTVPFSPPPAINDVLLLPHYTGIDSTILMLVDTIFPGW